MSVERVKDGLSRGYLTLEVLGPEHEFSAVDEHLQPLPIVDRVIKGLCGRVRSNVYFPGFAFGKELQKHVAELKAATPFHSPLDFEETMHQAVLKISEVLKKYDAQLLGSGMHPTLKLDKAEVWDHKDRQIYEAFDRLFNLRQHGWLNIQSFQLNLPYSNESDAVKLYNLIANILPYIPAISAASPIYESRFGEFIDNRLHYYKINQSQIPSITGDIIPEPIQSLEDYQNLTIKKYSADLLAANAPNYLINKEWINSRGAIIRFDRKAIEIRVMDEQECIKSDVALSCFIRSLLRGLMQSDKERSRFNVPHPILVENLNKVIAKGLNAKINHPEYSTAREICQHLYELAYEHASEDERRYLWIVKKRIDEGSLSEIVSRHVKRRLQRTTLSEAILDIYSALAESLVKNELYP